MPLSPKIAQVVVGLPVDGPFDYAVPSGLRGNIREGQRVKVLFNHRPRLGFVVGFKKQSRFKNLQSILSLLDTEPSLSPRALRLTNVLSAYYGCSWGEAMETYLPAYLRSFKAAELTRAANPGEPVSDHPARILVHDKSLHKRWEFILKWAQETVAQKQSVLILAPEAEMLEYVRTQLASIQDAPVLILDKKLKPKDEFEHWLRARQEQPCVVLGTRSAVFAPAAGLGLIILLEEEHSAYKQEQLPHYHARETALMRADQENCRVVFVSSVPSAGTWHWAQKQKWQVVTCEAEGLASMQVVDMTNYNPRRTSIISFPLQNQIQEYLQQRKKIIFFMNRRGFGTQTGCLQCGFVFKCPHCDLPAIYMYSQKRLICRHCTFSMEWPKKCPQCQGSLLRSQGTGIEKLESEAARMYPQARVSRFDKESGRWPAADIVIATQAMFKKRGELNAALIAVMNFDAELNHQDFRTAHKAFSLLIHLRQLAREKLFVQTRLRDHDCVKAASRMDFNFFYRRELKTRKELGLPPFRHLMAVGVRGRREENVVKWSQDLCGLLKKNCPGKIEVSDPYPDVLRKLRDQYRYIIMLKGISVGPVVKIIKKTLRSLKRKSGVIVTINVDP